MEFFQTISTALTAPNESLIKAFLIPLNFIEAFLSMFLFTTILNINATKKQKLIYVLCFGTFGTLSTIFIPSSLACSIVFTSIL